MVQNSLGLIANLWHYSARMNWVFSIRSLSWKHDTVRPVKNSISNIRCLCPCWSWAINHWFQHLCSCDDWLGMKVGKIDHPFLSDEYLFNWDLHTHISSSNHNSICLFNNFRVVFQSLLILNFCNDLNTLASWAKNVSNVSNVFNFSNEAGCNHVNSIRNAKIKYVFLVLLCQSRKMDYTSWQIHVLSRP